MSYTFRKPLIISVFILLPLMSPFSIESLHKVEPGESLYSLASEYDCSVEELKNLNNLNRDVLFSGEELKIPQSYADKHIVSSGETLSGIAARYGIPQEKLMSVNKMKNTMLRRAQELELIRPPYAGEIWTVQKGDTLSWISLKFNISQERLKQINMLNSSSLKLGQTIKLTAPRPQTVTVAQGDSLWNISKRYELSMDDIKNWNNLSSDFLRKGMALQLYPVTLELSDDEVVLAARSTPTDSTPKETTEQPVEETELRLAAVNLIPALYFSSPTGRRTQPSADYYEEDLNDPLVNYKDAAALMDEFTEAAKSLPPMSRKLKGYTIILDPGHGGLDPGAIVENSDGYGNKVYVVEDEYCYDISLRVYRDLIRHGADVHLTVISPNQTIRTTEDASITFVNQKNEVYNSRIINSLDRRYVWPVGNTWGLDQRKEAAAEYLDGIRKKKTAFISIHADNNPGDGEGSRVLYHPDESGTASQELAEHLSKNMGLGSISRAQDIRVLHNNPAGVSALVEVRNLAYRNNAWAIRNEELRQDDADRIVRGIVSYFN
ncbi:MULTISPECIES: LysM peptidoglycan-binding domain-containing protein [unclassified Oceanispirochaeta]|uniref:LysM peptidoglycan-binding domain-containing protein n=1 Tax=unclassified Oceanispirochaeta TaxID=2635722 RepID=UPI000E090EA2|nr:MULTISPECIES: LysM peptidoglycan-binding domain-containing protein [unclassified Oceanispirochaeta]MBF9015720.1 LysM peptidoglycan-binding domain-containing protein [Oceanispirochaeta sp. M2]NPD72185.1 LysM peptidoglycan-binding domain-containing protein [Oceanispirochaeta sp. M1]RDG32285.1 LysM peptidoglycan-binding domain-containing protein [Oceanispirochaeta sp. M1]